ncbi:MAG: hypothetical protein NTY38_18095, partial [Acidobacteria bacterium]|nr:hypothetical protein [Acidobacteriota bacterium]
LSMPAGGDSTGLMLNDPAAAATIFVVMTDKKTNPQITKDLRDGVDEAAKGKVAYYKDYTVRPDSIRPLQVNGKEAISAIADYTEGDRKMVDYLVWVRSAEARVNFFSKTNAADLDSLRKRLDPIVQTLQMP